MDIRLLLMQAGAEGADDWAQMFLREAVTHRRWTVAKAAYQEHMKAGKNETKEAEFCRDVEKSLEAYESAAGKSRNYELALARRIKSSYTAKLTYTKDDRLDPQDEATGEQICDLSETDTLTVDYLNAGTTPSAPTEFLATVAEIMRAGFGNYYTTEKKSDQLVLSRYDWERLAIKCGWIKVPMEGTTADFLREPSRLRIALNSTASDYGNPVASLPVPRQKTDAGLVR
jgi:hypothetical protein